MDAVLRLKVSVSRVSTHKVSINQATADTHELPRTVYYGPCRNSQCKENDAPRDSAPHTHLPHVSLSNSTVRYYSVYCTHAAMTELVG